MPQITLKNFKGFTLDESKWQDAYSKYCYGIDLYGLAKNPSFISFPGVLQSHFETSAGSQAASPSAVTELQVDFAYYKGNNFSIGPGTAARVYRADSPWKWVSSISGENANDDGTPNLEVYADNLYYAQKNYLGQYNNATSSSQFQTFSDTTLGPRPMKVYNGSLYIGNQRYVAKYDGTTFTGTKLTLPSNYIVYSIEVFQDLLYIMASNTQISTLFVWDGTSNTYLSSFDLTDESTAPKLKVAGGILWVVAIRGLSTPGTPIYTFGGGVFNKVITLPLGTQDNTGLAEYAGGLLVASTDDVTAGYEDGISGVWYIGRHSSDSPYYAVLLFVLRQLPNNTLGGITPGFIGAYDVTNASYEIFEVQGSGGNPTSVWQSLPIDAGSNSTKDWNGIELNYETLSSQTIVVKYRLDDATSWTTLKTITSSTTEGVFFPIGKSSKTIDLRVELTTSGTGESTRLHSITLDYTPNGE